MDSSGKSSFFGAAIIVSAVVVCALTNPSKQEHLHAISNKNVLFGGIAQLASFLGGVEYNNYVVCSTLSADTNTLTFGILKNVVVNE